MIETLFSFFVHLDSHLSSIFDYFGIWTYVILFFVIFAETGLIFFPFLPGDSLLFAVGAFAALGHLNVTALLISLFVAAIIGDSVNYFIGRNFGKKIVDNPKIPINQEHLDETQRFYEKNGGKTIVIARFIPIIRTFAPFVAGASNMRYKDFMFFNVMGAFVWVFAFVLAGYFFGNLPAVKNNLEVGIIGVILLSFLPVIFEFIKIKYKTHKK